MQQKNTAACKMRDELIKQRQAKKITLIQITDRLYKIGIPEWLQAQIIQMIRFNQYKRITCPVELAMESAVIRKIITEIMQTN